MRRLVLFALAAVAGLIPLVGCQQPAAPPPAVEVSLGGVSNKVVGPYTFRNVTAYLLCSATQDDRDFLTLDEGLSKGTVQVTEKAEERVQELLLDNRSDRPLYLQEGERLQGGKQDRIIIASLVVGPHSGPRPIPTMCVEHHRWKVGEKGREFGGVANQALAPKGVRGLAKIQSSQDGVWHCVGVQKGSGCSALRTANTNSSLNETLEAPEARKVSEEYAAGLLPALDEHPDAVGVALVINGRLEEANLYPNHAVFARFYPRLVRSYAIQVALLQEKGDAPAVPTPAEVAAMLRVGSEKPLETKKVDPQNTLDVSELEGNRFACVSRHEGKVIHWQLLVKNGASGNKEADDRRLKVLGCTW